jgi:hypothetical protein
VRTDYRTERKRKTRAITEHLLVYLPVYLRVCRCQPFLPLPLFGTRYLIGQDLPRSGGCIKTVTSTSRTYIVKFTNRSIPNKQIPNKNIDYLMPNYTTNELKPTSSIVLPLPPCLSLQTASPKPKTEEN